MKNVLCLIRIIMIIIMDFEMYFNKIIRCRIIILSILFDSDSG